MTKARVREASLSGREVSCDRCGAVVDRGEVVSLYHGPRGEKTDLCPSCLARPREVDVDV